MEAIVVEQTPRLRRYAHALLGSWPAAPRRVGEAVARVDQDADDLVHEALLGFWRAGFPGTGCGEGGIERQGERQGMREEVCRIALFRRVTLLASTLFVRKAAEVLAMEGRRPEDGVQPACEQSHFAWAPEARALPRLALDLRALLALVALERMTYAQAGAVLDMPAERALARLAVARARLASAISGESRPHLRALPAAEWATGRLDLRLDASPVTEGELHRFVDEFVDDRRRAEIGSFLEAHPDVMRRACEWRRHSERLRRAFEPLLREPLPLSLNFAAPETSLWARRRPLRAGDSILQRLAALLAAPDARARTAQRPV